MGFPMRHMLALLAAAALSLTLATAAGVPKAVAASPEYVCTEEDVLRVVEDAAPRTVQDPALEASFANCQFRLYDDNDGETPDSPEVPHTFSDDEWFMAGVLTWMTKEDLKDEGLTKKQGSDTINNVVDRLFLGESGGPLVEVPLESTEIRTVHDPEYKWLIINQHYAVFPPGSLAPGTYSWRAELGAFGDTDETSIIHGVLIVTDG
jgi:hypothetical protein